MSEIVNRISLFIKFKGLAVMNVETSIGISNGTLAKAISNGKSIKTETLESFLKVYTEINPYWLLYGTGEMFISESMNLAAEPGAEYGKKDSLLQLFAKEVIQGLSGQMTEDSKKLDYIYNALTKAEFLVEFEKMNEKLKKKKTN